MEKQKQKFERIFNFFDSNKDGRICASELIQCVGAIGGALTEAEAEAGIGYLDSDGDGLLGFDDFVRLVEGGNEEEKVNDLKQAFQLYVQIDGCGCITPQSLKSMLRRLGEMKSTSECEVMISQFDIDGDGVLNFDEFKVMML